MQPGKIIGVHPNYRSRVEEFGVRPEAIRLSVGIEHIEHILEDLDQALEAP